MALSDLTTRRSVVATGVKIAYAAPVVASSIKLSTIGAGAVSGGGNCVCTSWILSSGPGGEGLIEVDDDLVISLNGGVIFADQNGSENHDIAPIAFEAKCGDSLRVEGYNTFAPVQSLSPLWLTCASDVDDTRKLTDGIYDDNAPGPGPDNPNKFFDQTFTI